MAVSIWTKNRIATVTAIFLRERTRRRSWVTTLGWVRTADGSCRVSTMISMGCLSGRLTL
jgi:hypothetical protein